MYVLLQLNINTKFLLYFNVLLKCLCQPVATVNLHKIEMELLYVFYFITCFLNHLLNTNNTLAYFSSNFDSFCVEAG